MNYYEKHFSLEDVEKIFDEYCEKFKIDDLEIVNRFIITREFQDDQFLESSRNGVISKLRSFIEFHHRIVFKIRDRERECDILEIVLGGMVWGLHRLDGTQGKCL